MPVARTLPRLKATLGLKRLSEQVCCSKWFSETGVQREAKRPSACSYMLAILYGICRTSTSSVLGTDVACSVSSHRTRKPVARRSTRLRPRCSKAQFNLAQLHQASLEE